MKYLNFSPIRILRISLICIVFGSTLTGCGASALAPLMAGMKLSDENGSGLFMSDSEVKTLPYQAQPSNSDKKPDDAGKLYGFIQGN